MVGVFTFGKQLAHPIRLEATTGPGLVRRIGVSEFRMHLGIFATLRRLGRAFVFYLFEPPLELQLLRLHFCSQDRGDLLMKRP